MTGKIIFLGILILILSGCGKIIQIGVNVSQDIGNRIKAEEQLGKDKPQATVKCQELCQQMLSSNGRDFEAGPCLSEEIIKNWVCDMAHSPRQVIDDLPANQCAAFRQGRAGHFVEVDGNCNLIKAN